MASEKNLNRYSAAHAVYNLHYHIVFCPKYRRPVLETLSESVKKGQKESAEKGQKKSNKKGKHTNHTKVLSLIIIDKDLDLSLQAQNL